MSCTVADPGFPVGGMDNAPLQDPILLFLHTFSPKSSRVGGPHPPTSPCPLQEILDPPLRRGRFLVKMYAKMKELQRFFFISIEIGQRGLQVNRKF